MLRLKGEMGAEYFHVRCEECGKNVRLNNYRWVGGVPQIEAECGTCNSTWDFKLDPVTWVQAFPLPGS